MMILRRLFPVLWEEQNRVALNAHGPGVSAAAKTGGWIAADFSAASPKQDP